MSLASRAGDIYYTYRFIKLITTPWEETDAFKLKLIDAEGNRVKTEKIDTSDKKDAYTPFHRLAFNVKRLLNRLPGGNSKLASYAASLYLLREKYNIGENNLNKILSESGIDLIDMLNENSEWYLLQDKRLSPGVYKVKHDKLLNSTLDEFVKAKDKIRISESCYPIDNIFGIDIYEVTHVNTRQSIYVTLGEIYK